MSITLSGRQTRMTQQFLNHPQVGTAVEQMRRKTMAQAVRSHLQRNTGELQMLLNDARDAPRGDTLAAVVEKYRRFSPAAATPFFALLGGIVSQRAKRHFSDGDDAFFGTFAHDAKD